MIDPKVWLEGIRNQIAFEKELEEMARDLKHTAQKMRFERGWD